MTPNEDDGANKNDGANITDMLEIRLTFVGSPADSFERKVRKRMPTLARATEVACGDIRRMIEKRLGTGAGMRFTLVSASKLLTDDEKRALLTDHNADKEEKTS